MASTVGQFITSKKYEKLIRRNINDPTKIAQLTHLYLVLKEGLQGRNIKMRPIKDGIRLSIPHLGPMNVYIYNNNDSGKNPSFYENLQEEPINTAYSSNRFNPQAFNHKHGDLYFNTSKTFVLRPTNYSDSQFHLFNKEYVVSSVKTAIDYYSKRHYKNIPALRLKDE